ncbi:MAG TPA: hypothetical protein VF300_05185 [Methanothrix sp.]
MKRDARELAGEAWALQEVACSPAACREVQRLPPGEGREHDSGREALGVGIA